MDSPEASIRLNKHLIAHLRVIARGMGIRDVAHLVRQYGGTPARWAKKSSPVLTYQGRRVEVHWYEHHGIGRVEIKLKWISTP